jgi:hypothetical protein
LDNVKKTLIELTIKNFNNVKRKEVKSSINHSEISVSAIIIRSAIRDIKEDKSHPVISNLEDGLKEEKAHKKVKKAFVNGGYGTVSRHYGMSPVAKYVDYDKIWGHLGAFRTYSPYSSNESNIEIAMKNGATTREMVSIEVIEKAAKHFKYFMSGEVLGDIGFVPPFGANISSKDWEKYRLMSMMSIYRPLLALKWRTA